MVKVFEAKGKVGKRTPDLHTRIQAATWLADRGFGKPAQPLTGDEDGGPVGVTMEMLLREVEEDGG